jgi:hypothetical protein
VSDGNSERTLCIDAHCLEDGGGLEALRCAGTAGVQGNSASIKSEDDALRLYSVDGKADEMRESMCSVGRAEK